MLHFDINISMLWRDLPFVERFEKAKTAGFDAVEFLWPRGENLDEVVSAIQDAHLRVVLHNMDSGDMPKGDRGYANDPNRKDEWRRMFQEAVDFSKRVGCSLINCLAGNDLGASSRDEQMQVVAENYQWALPIAERHGIVVCVEPLNTFDTPKFLWPHTQDGIAFMRRVNSPFVKLQFDVYHMHRMGEDVVQMMRQHIADIGHIQFADVPGRHEPGTGEIKWRDVFQTIEDSGYNGFLGLEYIPSTTADESLRWLPQGKRNEATMSELNL